MKRVLALAVVALALGVWGGVRAWHSATIMVGIQAGLAVALGCILVLSVWLWYRARPGSGDAMVMPFVVLSSGSMLIFILPRLLWPSAEGLHIAGSVVSAIAPTAVLIMQIRRRRRLHRGARPL